MDASKDCKKKLKHSSNQLHFLPEGEWIMDVVYMLSEPYLRKQCRAIEIAVDVLDQIQALSSDLAVVLKGRHLWRET
jgi:hypothetical protein